MAKIATIIIGFIMSIQANADIDINKFDDLWTLGDPAVVEKKFQEILPEAEKNKSIYLQIMSQIALAQAMQKKFDEAHKTLDEAEKRLTPETKEAKTRILLERGRIFHQASFFQIDDKTIKNKLLSEAKSFFEQSYDYSKKKDLDYHAANAAHMLAIIVEHSLEKIKWNEIAITLADQSKDARAKLWLGPLYNNLGQNYLEVKEFSKALPLFERALALREKEGYASNIRVAKWAVAHTLRLLNRFDDSLDMLNALLKEYETIIISGKLDVPDEIFFTTRGFVYEDLAEIYVAKAKAFSKSAHSDLSQASWIHLDEHKHRLARLKDIEKI